MTETVPTERAKKTRSKKGYWGSSQWNRVVDLNEMAEHVRVTEDTIDEHGMRNIEMIKGDKATENSAIATYRRLGYKVIDEDWRFIFQISQADYEKNEAKRIAEYNRLKNTEAAPNKQLNKMPVDSYDRMPGVSMDQLTADDLLNDAINP